MSDAEVAASLTRSHAAYRSWHTKDLAERCALRQRIADLHRQHSIDLAKLMTLEMGKPITQAKAEVELSAAIYEYYATSGEKLLADEELDIAGAGQSSGQLPSDHSWASCRGTSPITKWRGSSPPTCAGQHHPAQARQQLPATSTAHCRNRRRGRGPGRRLPEPHRHLRTGRGHHRQPQTPRRIPHSANSD